MIVDHAMRRLAAQAVGAFWLPCPSCGEMFGGHEWRDYLGHYSSIPGGDDPQVDHGICPDCTAKGVGCVAQATRTDGRETFFHLDCSVLAELGVTPDSARWTPE